MTFFIEHIKAYRVGYKQLQAKPTAKIFCHALQCTNLADKKCGRCGQAWYCSPEHQKFDWQLKHKNQCKINLDQLESVKEQTSAISQITNPQQISGSIQKIQKSFQQDSQPEKKSDLQDDKPNTNSKQEISQCEIKQKEADQDWELLKKQQNLLLSQQSIFTPDPSQSNQSDQVSLNKQSQQINHVSPLAMQLRLNLEECKEPQDDTPRQKATPAKSQSTIDQTYDWEDRISQLELSKFQLQNENLQLKEQINTLEQEHSRKIHRLELDVGQKVLKLEQEQFELRQQVKLLMRKLN